jgi:hypothetical protein
LEELFQREELNINTLYLFKNVSHFFTTIKSSKIRLDETIVKRIMFSIIRQNDIKHEKAACNDKFYRINEK